MEGQEEYSSAYIDDVIIFSNSWVEHLQNIQLVLEALRKNGLKVKASKCQWGAKSLVYLGHEVGCGRVSVPEAKVEAIRKFVNLKQRRIFRHSSAHLATIAASSHIMLNTHST